MTREMLICGAIHYIESHIREEISYQDLEKAAGISCRYSRQLFARHAQVQLSCYIKARKIANAAFELGHTAKTVTESAMAYEFQSHDMFTRTFKRYLGITPTAFRQTRQMIATGPIGVGMYGSILPENQPNACNRELVQTNNDECILFGIPKVEVTTGKCIPFTV